VYPELTAPLLALVGGAGVVLLVIAVRAPVLRRLALRQVARRPSESALVVAGSLLGTAIIVGSLIVGDTLGFSVRQAAYSTLGPVDERVVSSSPVLGAQVASRVRAGLSGSAEVDGVLSGVVEQTAALHHVDGKRLAEPRVLAFDVDLAQAARFGGEGASGLSVPAPEPGRAVVNEAFAKALDLSAGDSIELFLSGSPQTYRVERVVRNEGLAGTGFGSTLNRNVFLPPGTLSSSQTPGTRWVTWVSNRGGTESGSPRTAAVADRIRAALGPVDRQVVVSTPKKDVLRQAEVTGDTLGALFLMIGSFSIIAGALLLVNVFVMLAEERKGQLGMLRAAGLKRSRLVGAFTLEGAVYAVLACALGVVLGIGVGRAVAFVAARIFSSFSTEGNALDVTFAVSRTSLVNGAALGLVISLATVLATSLRISRFNIIAAIRDLEAPRRDKGARRRLVLSTSAAVLLALVSVPVVAASSPLGTFLLPSLAAMCALPLLRRWLGTRRAQSAVFTGILAWTLLVNVVRPDVYASSSMSVFVVLGSLLAFSAVALLSDNQQVLLRPFRRLLERPTPDALAGRLALAYPLAKRFRTGATLIMYSLITLVLVLLIEIGGVMMHGIDDQVGRSTAGYSIRLDFTPGQVVDRVESLYKDQVSAVAPLLTATASATDPGHRSTEPLQALVVGVRRGTTRTMTFELRLPGLATDGAVWDAVATHPDYVVVDPFFGSTGGPGGEFFKPGDTFEVTDPVSGTAETKVIAGVLSNAVMFYSPNAPAAFPLITDVTAVRNQFGPSASVASAFLKARPGVDLAGLSQQLQASYLDAGLVATPMPAAVRRLFEANVAFFRLMEGFLALGLLVGVTGLGVVMVRSVRERRRSIGILRALGFPARTIERSFLMESGFVAVEGASLGSLLGLLTTWLLYQRSATFAGLHSGFPVLWETILVLVVVTVATSLLTTLGPARRAARILPAVATRTAD
jgi:putative ABC transport system permease protein